MSDQSDTSTIHYMIEGAGALFLALFGFLRSADAERVKKVEISTSDLWKSIDDIKDADRKRWEEHHAWLDRKFSDLSLLIQKTR